MYDGAWVHRAMSAELEQQEEQLVERLSDLRSLR
jgi:hypothetical protein